VEHPPSDTTPLLDDDTSTSWWQKCWQAVSSCVSCCRRKQPNVEIEPTEEKPKSRSSCCNFLNFAKSVITAGTLFNLAWFFIGDDFQKYTCEENDSGAPEKDVARIAVVTLIAISWPLISLSDKYSQKLKKFNELCSKLFWSGLNPIMFTLYMPFNEKDKGRGTSITYAAVSLLTLNASIRLIKHCCSDTKDQPLTRCKLAWHKTQKGIRTIGDSLGAMSTGETISFTLLDFFVEAYTTLKKQKIVLTGLTASTFIMALAFNIKCPKQTRHTFYALNISAAFTYFLATFAASSVFCALPNLDNTKQGIIAGATFLMFAPMTYCLYKQAKKEIETKKSPDLLPGLVG